MWLGSDDDKQSALAYLDDPLNGGPAGIADAIIADGAAPECLRARLVNALQSI